LDALRCDPEAFGSTFDAEDAQPLTWFSDRIRGSDVFGALHDAALVGIATLLILKEPKEAHKVLMAKDLRPAASGQRAMESA